MSSVCEQKRELRRRVRTRMGAIPAEDRIDLARRAIVQLLKRPEWIEAKSILAYLPMADELDSRSAIEEALRHGKTVAVPSYCPADGIYRAAVISELERLRPGHFGVFEPEPDSPLIPLKRLDFVLVPGVAFAPNGYRLGRGKGFYDRLLADVTGVKCGVALDEQIVPILPVEPHDIAMDFILTPSRWLRVAPAGN